jgi:hypothetical protein
MTPMILSPWAWLRHVFSAEAASSGAVLRRKVSDVERFHGRDAFLQEMRRRGNPVAKNAGQFVAFYTREPIRRLVSAGSPISVRKSDRDSFRFRRRPAAAVPGLSRGRGLPRSP